MAKKDLIYSDQLSMFGAKEIIGFGSNEFHIKEIDRNKANDIIAKTITVKSFIMPHTFIWAFGLILNLLGFYSLVML